MQWVIDNWVLVLLGGGFVAMHLFGHGHGHGRKGRHDDVASNPDDRADPKVPDAAEPPREGRHG